MMVMGLFTVFWLSFGLIQLPTLKLAAAYSPTGDYQEGLASHEYNAVIALYLIVWGFALLTYFVFTLKTNVIIAGIFFFVTIAAWVLAGAYFKVASGDYATAGKLQTVNQSFMLPALDAILTYRQAGGALLFIVAILGWYMTFVIMSAEMRMGINFWVGDLSHYWPDTNVPLKDEEKND